MIKYYWIRLKMKYHYYVTQDMGKYEDLWEKKNKLKKRRIVMGDNEEKGLVLLSAVGIFLGSLALMFAGMLYGGFVTMVLWNGIISPTFGLGQLSFFQGLGLDLFVSYLVYSSKKSRKDKNESIFIQIMEATISTTLYWGMGSLIMLFI